MKRLYTSIIACLFVSSIFAQSERPMRGRVINITEYPKAVSPDKPFLHRLGSTKDAPLYAFGSPNVPVLLVQFQDQKVVTSVSQFELFCNGIPGTMYDDHGSYGSVADYFATVSHGQFTPHFEVIGPITLSQKEGYYGADNGNNHDIRFTEFFSESCSLAMTQHQVDWSKFDNNGDGKVDFLFIIFAGEGENGFPELPNLIWPKEWTTTYTVNADGKSITVGGFGCTNEVYNGILDGIGTMCHELSHALGLPDLYDNSYKLFGMDAWDVMDSGNYCCDSYWPVGYSAYELDFMGWQKLNEVPLESDTTITIQPLSRGGETYKILSPTNPNEYYTLENRQNDPDSYDYFLGVRSTYKSSTGKTHGLMITHVNYVPSLWASNSVNTNSEHLTIQAADGVRYSYTLVQEDKMSYSDYANSMRGDLYPGTSGNTETQIFGHRLRITENEDQSITIVLNNGSQPDGIETLLTAAADAPCYDLTGRRITTSPTRPGLYIRNGKKFFLRK